ncbi:hypothetical protein P4H94_22935 [Paenibacillus macerans]|uniref:hypothetical protein n=1 Tax=Paenibacillus macerans TaxID=44252 RepID=UPI002DB5E54F|nr:hypothetical protein [Paenibacillus macerans]MEC0139711.1 hypothetical protein [Paenibacillus macerans]
MIRLTSYTSGKAVSVSPELIKIVIEDENFTYIHFGPDDDYIKVSESREEVARKVLEWKLAMERIKAALLTDKKEIATAEYLNLRRLAGLEEPNHD